MRIFDFKDYKEFVRAKVESMPRGGRGQYRRIAEHLNINTVVVSQIFNGDRHLSKEQGCELSEFFGLSALEQEYLLALIELDRAGTHKLKTFINKQIERLLKKHQDLTTRIDNTDILSEQAKATYYSNWYYGAIRLITAIEKYRTVDEISEFLKIPKAAVQSVFDFLVSNGLCFMEGNKLRKLSKSTVLEPDHPLVSRHRQNWRIKAQEYLPFPKEKHLFYSGVMTMSHENLTQIKKLLLEHIEGNTQMIKTSASDLLVCLNIDLFDL